MLRLGTRGSRLAMAQSGQVAERIRTEAGVPVELKVIRTQGDAILDQPLSAIGGKGLFTRELDVALLDGEIDLAVHSLKDLPTAFPEGLALGAVPEREDPYDVLVGPRTRRATLGSLPRGSRVGTSSLRRASLLRLHRPDLQVSDIRGNLDTRIRKVDEGEFQAIVVAAAGLRRMGWEDRIHETLDDQSWLPAPAQGALGLVIRSEDADTFEWLSVLEDEPSRVAVTAERALLAVLEAGCRLPVAALAIPFPRGVRLRAMVSSPDGQRVVRAQGTGVRAEPEALGRRVAGMLLDRGADLLLRDLGVTPMMAP